MLLGTSSEFRSRCESASHHAKAPRTGRVCIPSGEGIIII